MTKNERNLLIVIAEIFTQREEITPSDKEILQRTVRGLVQKIKIESEEVKPGKEVAVKVIVTKVENGLVYFRTDDGTEVYRRVGDIVR